jgi:hypothetical protein
MDLDLHGDPPPIYKAWVRWLFAKPEITRQFLSDPVGSTEHANLGFSSQESAQLLAAVTFMTKILHGRR